MRLQGAIKIDDKEYTIRELTVKEIFSLFKETESTDTGNQIAEEYEISLGFVSEVLGSVAYVKRFLDLAMPGTSLEDLIELPPSDLNKIWEKLKEINKYFFEMAQQIKLGEKLKEATVEVLATFLQHAVDLSKLVMEQQFTNMDTPTS